MPLLEVLPVNFLLRSTREQRSIIYSFISYLKISPIKVQFKVITKKADINQHLRSIEQEIEAEEDENCIALQNDYMEMIKSISSKEAITRRFFIIFEYEPYMKAKGDEEQDALSFLQTATNTARTYLQKCGNVVVEHNDEDEMIMELMYMLLNRKTSIAKPFSDRMKEVYARNIVKGIKDGGEIPVTDFLMPSRMEFNRYDHIVVDGVYHSYLLIPTYGYRTKVYAGWLSLLVNAGEGIDVDVFIERQNKSKMQQKIGQQLRLNRSRIKDASDTNTDFIGGLWYAKKEQRCHRGCGGFRKCFRSGQRYGYPYD